jgi:YD repeat-containing protein
MATAAFGGPGIRVLLVQVGDGDDVTLGAISDSALLRDGEGTLSAKLRGLVNVLGLYTRRTVNNSEGLPIYKGWAAPGTETSAAAWRIQRITWDANGYKTAEEWAGGNTDFAHVWDNAASLEYA